MPIPSTPACPRVAAMVDTRFDYACGLNHSLLNPNLLKQVIFGALFIYPRKAGATTIVGCT